MTKYRNCKVEYAGMTFDSKKEMHRYIELGLLARSNVVSNLRRQVRFCVIDKINNERPSHYVADFVYDEVGAKKTIIEDVKPYDKRAGKFLLLPEFKLKWKLMQTRYPEYEYRIY